MIKNKPSEKVFAHEVERQRLGNKTLFTNIINKNQEGVNVRYFSGIDAEIYFEDVYIDETVQISFNVQQQSLPLYGYNSYVYDDIALGSRIVSGQFTINFTKSNYMYQILDTLSSIKNSQTQTTKNISSRAPLWNKTFDIYMSYGDAKQSNRVKNSTILVLKKVSLTSSSQELDYSGKPIYETYSFIAKDIDFITEGEYEEKTTPVIKQLLPIAEVYYDLADPEKVLVQFVFEKQISIYSLEYSFSFMNTFEVAYQSSGEEALSDTLIIELSKDLSKRVVEFHTKNENTLAKDIGILTDTKFKDSLKADKKEQQKLKITKRTIKM